MHAFFARLHFSCAVLFFRSKNKSAHAKKQYQNACVVSMNSALYYSLPVTVPWDSGVATGGHGGTECHPWQQKNCQKSGKRAKKLGKKSKNWEEKAKIGKVLSLCPLIDRAGYATAARPSILSHSNLLHWLLSLVQCELAKSEPPNQYCTACLRLQKWQLPCLPAYSPPLTNASFRLACRSPLCRYVSWSPLAVSWFTGSSQRPRRFGLSSSGIAPELNWSQLYAKCRSRQSGKVIDLLARRCLLLGQPSAASGACAVVQISSSKRQCGERQLVLFGKGLVSWSSYIFTPVFSSV